MVDLVRLALRLTTTAFDDEIRMLIEACFDELDGLGIASQRDGSDPQIKTAVVAYCKWKFGENDKADQWERIYHDMVAKLQCRAGYGLR